MKKKPTRLLVCGGRFFQDYFYLDLVLKEQRIKLRKKGRPIKVIIHGAASGADSMAGAWAEKKGIKVLSFYPNWSKYGKAAGPIRNQQMLDEGKPNLVIAFEGGTGTNDMIKKARKVGIKVIEISKNTNSGL